MGDFCPESGGIAKKFFIYFWGAKIAGLLTIRTHIPENKVIYYWKFESICFLEKNKKAYG